MPGVKRVPAALQKDLEPRAEIHQVGNRRHPDVAEIARAVPGCSCSGTRQSIGGQIPCKRRSLPDAHPSRSRRARVSVAEAQAIVQIVTNCLDACPSGRHTTEERPGSIRKTVGFAVAAASRNSNDSASCTSPTWRSGIAPTTGFSIDTPNCVCCNLAVRHRCRAKRARRKFLGEDHRSMDHAGI